MTYFSNTFKEVIIVFCGSIVVGHGTYKDLLKAGLSPSNFFLICFNDSLSKMIKNAFYFISKALFVLKIFKFLS